MTEYPPRVGGWPSVALNPAETRMMSGLYSLAMGTTTLRNAARYSASPKFDAEDGRGREGGREGGSEGN